MVKEETRLVYITNHLIAYESYSISKFSLNVYKKEKIHVRAKISLFGMFLFQYAVYRNEVQAHKWAALC